MASKIVSHLRMQRVRAGLSQSQLAARVGVSRQTMNGIELGRQVPSTLVALRLARELNTSVHRLFALPRPTSLEVASTGQLQPGMRVVCGWVGERWVAHPCHDVRQRAHGVVGEGITATGAKVVDLFAGIADPSACVLVAGCAPILGLLGSRMGPGSTSASLGWVAANSRQALAMLQQGLVHMAGIHLGAEDDARVHSEVVRSHFPGRSLALVHLTRWHVGLVSNDAFRATSEALSSELRWIHREPGAGTQASLHRWYGRSGGDLAVLNRGRTAEARSHEEVAQLIRWGLGDVGMAIASAARHVQLSFTPLIEERFDLIVAAEHLDSPGVAQVIDGIRGRGFRAEVESLGGYDMSQAGQVLEVGA